MATGSHDLTVAMREDKKRKSLAEADTLGDLLPKYTQADVQRAQEKELAKIKGVQGLGAVAQIPATLAPTIKPTGDQVTAGGPIQGPGTEQENRLGLAPVSTPGLKDYYKSGVGDSLAKLGAIQKHVPEGRAPKYKESFKMGTGYGYDDVYTVEAGKVGHKGLAFTGGGPANADTLRTEHVVNTQLAKHPEHIKNAFRTSRFLSSLPPDEMQLTAALIDKSGTDAERLKAQADHLQAQAEYVKANHDPKAMTDMFKSVHEIAFSKDEFGNTTPNPVGILIGAMSLDQTSPGTGASWLNNILAMYPGLAQEILANVKQPTEKV